MAMKRLFLFLMLPATLFVACDIIEFPIEEPEAEVVVDNSIFPKIDTASINMTTQKVFVEEFTGHHCASCPSQTELLLDQQKNANGEIIALAIHAGDFADIIPPKLLTDFTTPYGDAVFQEFLSPLTGIPAAMVNRIDNQQGSEKAVFSTHAAWSVPIADQVGNPANLALGLAVDYIVDSNAFAISLAVKGVQETTGEHRLVLLCMEDSVIDAQKDNRNNSSQFPGQITEKYTHRHVQRAQLNESAGLFGEVLISDALAIDEWVGGEYYFFVPDNVVDPTNCSIIAFILNNETGNVVQVEEAHVHVVEGNVE